MTTTEQAGKDPRKLAESAREWIVDIAAGRREWRMCIPVQPDDTDVVLMGLYKAYMAALDRIDELENPQLAHLRGLDKQIAEVALSIGTQED